MTVSRWVTDKTRSTALKSPRLQNLSPNHLPRCLRWPCPAAQAHVQCSPVLPGRNCQVRRFCIGNGDSGQKGALTPPKWLFKRLNANVLILLFTGSGAAPRLGLPCALPPRPALLTHPSLKHHFPLLVLKLSFRPIPSVSNWVIYSSCRLLPTGPLEIGGKKKEKIGIQHLSLFSLILSIILSKPKFAPRSNHIEEYFQTVYKPRVNSLLIRSWNSWQRDRCWNAFKLGGKPA